MKKENRKAGVIILSLTLLGLLLIPIISASSITDVQDFFKNLFGGGENLRGDTGELASLSEDCTDSDGGINPSS